MTGELLEHGYGPTHPLYLGADGAPAAPAGVAILLTATDVLRAADQGHPLGDAGLEARLVEHLRKARGDVDDLHVLVDVGALPSARRAWQQWQTRAPDTTATPTVTGPVTGVTATVTDEGDG